VATEEQEREIELRLTIGARVRLHGSLGWAYTVIAMRPARHGTWYHFRADDGHSCHGYASLCSEVIAYAVDA
jgi:hypothetical protein